MPRRYWLFPLWAAFLACSATPSILSNSSSIVGGVFTPDLPAVVALTRGPQIFCTGTLISRRVIVTAAHCTDSALTGVSTDNLFAFFGPDVRRQDGIFVPVEQQQSHPNFSEDTLANDIGVVVLAEDAPVAPLPFFQAPFDESILGREALFVGYGLSSVFEGTPGLKRSVTLPIADFTDSQFFYLSTQGGGNTCFGDSGGPALLPLSQGDTVIGVTSFGDSTCTSFGADTRVDVFAGSFLQPFLDAEPPVESGCELDSLCNPSCTGTDPDCQLLQCGGGGECQKNCPTLDPDCPDVSCADDGLCDERCATPENDLDCFCNADNVCEASCGERDPDCDTGSCAVGGSAHSSWLLLALLTLLIRRRSAAQG